ncbi:MAG: FG-GAP-like repeat-containing protein [Gammaproteobacteria bacterium]|nr:FG-GAP-like repeat-containing protein [Gammaproteobacteria bacterium]
MPAQPRTGAWPAPALAAALLAACGGGSGGGGSPESAPALTNRPPSITVDSTASVDENQPGAAITSVAASDPDGDSVAFTVSDERFEISGGELRLKADESLDHEAEISVEVTITAGDGTASATARVTIAVNDIVASVIFADATPGSGIAFERGYTESPGGSSLPQDADVREFGGGVAAGDYDNDGRVDLFVLRGDLGPNLLYRNLGNNTFEDRAEEAGVANPRAASGSFRHSGPGFADMDGDGDIDLFLGGVMGDRAIVYRNNGDGTFTDATDGSGLESINARYTISSAFGDYDLDGDLDLFLAHWGTPRPKDDESRPWPYSTESLWRNDSENGVIRFTDVSLPSGIAQTIIEDNPVGSFGGSGHDYTFSPVFARITDDLYPDLVIAADFLTSKYYVNEGDGTFRDATNREVVVDGNGMGAAVGDYDNDGDLDWFVSSIWSDPDGNGEQIFKHGNRLYRNDGGELSDATEQAGVRDGGWGWGSCFADFDNDGHLDLYHTNGWVHVERFASEKYDTDPSRLFISDGAGAFTEISEEAGIADSERGHGIVCADFDNDGDIDIFQMHRNENNAGTLWRNDGSANNYLKVKLEGRAPNTAAAGARITLTAGGRNQMREITIGSNFTSQNPLVQLFGLGARTQADLAVEWPDGAATTRENVAAGQLVTIQQPEN